jgi:hypothetical protein
MTAHVLQALIGRVPQSKDLPSKSTTTWDAYTYRLLHGQPWPFVAMYRMAATMPIYSQPEIVGGQQCTRRCHSLAVEAAGRWRRRSCARRPCRVLARYLPETALHVASRRPTTQPSAASLTCAVMWTREVLQGVVNHPRIMALQGVRGSNPLSSTRHNASTGRPLRAVCQQIVSRSLHVTVYHSER